MRFSCATLQRLIIQEEFLASPEAVCHNTKHMLLGTANNVLNMRSSEHPCWL